MNISMFITVNSYWNLWLRNLWTYCSISWQTRTITTVSIEPQKTLPYQWGTPPWSEGESLMCPFGWSNSQGPFTFTAQLRQVNTCEYWMSFIGDGIWEPVLLFLACSYYVLYIVNVMVLCLIHYQEHWHTCMYISMKIIWWTRPCGLHDLQICPRVTLPVGPLNHKFCLNNPPTLDELESNV
jgi:hypothetical protein